MMCPRPSLAACLALVLVSVHGAALADAGTIVAKSGTVSVVRGGQSLPADVGFGVAAGDVINTGADSKAQVVFKDDSVFAIPAEGSLRVDSFAPRNRDTGTAGEAIFSLLRGGFRTVTGLIGKTKGDRYEVRTGMATIGVRGSGYASILCAASCAETARVPAGLYVKADKGLITLKNAHGALSLRPGQVGYVASSDTGPVRVDRSPFDLPKFSTSFSVDFDLLLDPPRIEQDVPASPSLP